MRYSSTFSELESQVCRINNKHIVTLKLVNLILTRNNRHLLSGFLTTVLRRGLDMHEDDI
jgi:hypothetical protein